MRPDKKKTLDQELEELRQRVMLHRQELRREMERPPERCNPMCARCINTCKQDESVKILHCARFEAI